MKMEVRIPKGGGGMIEIKTFFTDWHEVSREKAEKYIRQVMRGAAALTDTEKVKLVEEKRLRGITVDELLHREQ